MKSISSDNRPTEQDIIRWYEDNLDINKSFCKKCETLLEDIIVRHNVPFHSITGRVKKKNSLLRKYDVKNYKSMDDITDIIGIRIISFVMDDVSRICDIIKNEFEIDEDNSSDKSIDLKINETGYQSVHYILKLGSTRCNLPEWSMYNGRVIEIQVRTLLQHAWASISHENQYKFAGVLPQEINRRFYLTAGTLELLDIEFQRLADELNDYRVKVSEHAEKGDLQIELNTTSLTEYLENKFNGFVAWPNFEKSFKHSDDRIIQELVSFGINSIADLDKVISENEISKKLTAENYVEHRYDNYVGLLRDIMVITDADKYFESCYNGWYYSESEFSHVSAYVDDFEDILLRHNVGVFHN